MIKIFHIVTSIQLGGAEIIAFNLAEHCKHGQPEEIRAVIIELHQTKTKYSIDKKGELDMKNIKFLSLFKGSKRLSLLVAPFKLVFYLRKEKPQIIHSHTDLPDFVLSVTLRILSLLRLKAPQIVRTIQNTELWPTHYRMGKFTEEAFSNERIVGVSYASLQAYKNLRAKYNLAISNSQSVIYNTAATPERREHPFKIDKEKVNIGFCGRFVYQKGIDILIERIEEINSRFADSFLFHLIGSGSYFEDVQKLSLESNNVILYDAVPNISDKLYPFDFLIIPSRFEGLCITSIEASISKIPVIAAVAPGLTETLPSQWPLKFELESKEELLTIFEKIVNKQYDLDDLKNLSYSFVSENFSHKRMIELYVQLYTEISE